MNLRLASASVIVGFALTLTGTYAQQVAKPTEPRYEFVIQLELPLADFGGETETRAEIRFVEGIPAIVCLSAMRPYRVERVTSGGMPLELRSLAWAPGAEHVYAADRLTKDEATTLAHSRRLLTARKGPGLVEPAEPRRTPQGDLVMPLEGCCIEENPLAGWRIESEVAYPLTFKVIRGVGYVYMYGQGTVTSPLGAVRKLGEGHTTARHIRQMGSPDALSREAAVQALGWLGKGEKTESLQALVKALKDTQPAVRRSAAESLGRIGDQTVMPALQAASQDKHQLTAATAEWAMHTISSRMKAEE